MTDDEKLQRCFDHIRQCHDAMDRVYYLLVQHCPRNEENDFHISPDVFMEMYTTITQQFPDRPVQAMPYDESVTRPVPTARQMVSLALSPKGTSQ